MYKIPFINSFKNLEFNEQTILDTLEVDVTEIKESIQVEKLFEMIDCFCHHFKSMIVYLNRVVLTQRVDEVDVQQDGQCTFKFSDENLQIFKFWQWGKVEDPNNIHFGKEKMLFKTIDNNK